jgi:hypothetical protein
VAILEALMDPEEDELRAKVPTAEGVHLHEPDAFPHVMMAWLAAAAVGLVLVIVVTFMVAGVTGALVAGAALLLIGVPILVSRINRGAQRERRREIEEERRVEAQEHVDAEPGDAPAISTLARTDAPV